LGLLGLVGHKVNKEILVVLLDQLEQPVHKVNRATLVVPLVPQVYRVQPVPQEQLVHVV
jgi:hypothetical protein